MDMDEADRIYFTMLREKNRKAREEREAEEARRKEEMNRLGIEPRKSQYDSPYALGNEGATVLYVIAMAVSTIFHGRVWWWLLWTYLYMNYLDRHN